MQDRARALGLRVLALHTGPQGEARKMAESKAARVEGGRAGWQVLETHPHMRNHCSDGAPGSGAVLSRGWGGVGGLCFIFGFCQIQRIEGSMRTAVLKRSLCQVGRGLFLSNSI